MHREDRGSATVAAILAATLAATVVAATVDQWQIPAATAAGIIGKSMFDWLVRRDRNRANTVQKNLDTLIAGFRSLAQDALAEASAARVEVKELRDEVKELRTDLEHAEAVREAIAAERDGLAAVSDALRQRIIDLEGLT